MKKRIVALILLSAMITSVLPVFNDTIIRADETEEASVIDGDTDVDESGQVCSADASDSGLVAINPTNFPDDYFRNYVSDRFDRNHDGNLDSGELFLARAISVVPEWDSIQGGYSAPLVSSLQGIEFFPELEGLYCSGNHLTSLDVSHNPNLVYLNCDHNNLTNLDVSHNPQLRTLWVNNNNLTSLNLTSNINLYQIIAEDNNISILDISSCNPLLESINNHEKGYYLFEQGEYAGFGSYDEATRITSFLDKWDASVTLIMNSDAPAGYLNMYRLYNPNSGEHFYTSDKSERNNLITLGWNYEGIGWVAPVSSSTPVYRLYNAYGGEHHYTTNPAERDMLINLGWIDEDIGWYSDDSMRVPLYRQYNPNAFANNHNYTTSVTENDYLVSLGWIAEDIGWYGVG